MGSESDAESGQDSDEGVELAIIQDKAHVRRSWSQQFCITRRGKPNQLNQKHIKSLLPLLQEEEYKQSNHGESREDASTNVDRSMSSSNGLNCEQVGVCALTEGNFMIFGTEGICSHEICSRRNVSFDCPREVLFTSYVGLCNDEELASFVFKKFLLCLNDEDWSKT